jgi:hypothetical protein
VGNSSAAAEKASSRPHSANMSAGASPARPRKDRTLAHKQLAARIGGQNFTCGGRFTSSATVKVSIGFSFR